MEGRDQGNSLSSTLPGVAPLAAAVCPSWAQLLMGWPTMVPASVS